MKGIRTSGSEEDLMLADFARRVRDYREEKGITQVDLGVMIGISSATICYIENRGATNLLVVSRLSRLLGISMDEVFGGEEKVEFLNASKARREAALRSEMLKMEEAFQSRGDQKT